MFARTLHAIRLLRLIAQAWLGLIVFDIVALTGFSRIHAWVRASSIHPRTPAPSIDDTVWAVDEACVWYVKRAACLQRSAVATWLLRRRGIRAELVIGYRPLPFDSHAWVEVDGRVVNDRQQYRNVFTVLERL
ncbi:MAG: lasso peptide biosynthesis B2 protein [Acidobacteria bacterium]|nr:lasso peptide biosynthesis B2 protein [Acidobacteriota bacterium]